MTPAENRFEDYFAHLKQISLLGRLYKRYWASPILFWAARRFGKRIGEVGSGTGSGILGSFPGRVTGLEINPHAVAYCREKGLDAKLIGADGVLPVADHSFDVCVLDNVLEHIENPRAALDECLRVTTGSGGLVISVPGLRGFASDSDHKTFYSERELQHLHPEWECLRMFSTPFLFGSRYLSATVRQYCLVAIYKKKDR
ncbi:class I SAM-dependent methyltransferase [Rhodoferax sp. GW822-FHT02A01]|uniref:class I SAM-dependent methyltransferase n=1 Tax=Rhodoferax sp. GW822-FHT02A01 TaxID=3141537 RepID=UPI00315CC38E